MQDTTEQAGRLVAPPPSLARGFAALRIFFGLIFLSTALSKIFEVNRLDWGVFSFTLINRSASRGILSNAVASTGIGPLRTIFDWVLANWGFFQWFLTLAELAIGLGLLVGIAARLAAVGGLLLLAPIWLMLWDTSLYLWEYPLDLVPLALLAIVPAGRSLGLDGRLAARFRGRWPF